MKKPIIFKFLTILLPFLFLFLLELILRLLGYGDSYPLVKIETKFGKEKYIINRQVTKRYFSLTEEMIPESSEEIFDVIKRPNGFRLVCIGGSTTAGFPYEINATFPFQLQFRLREALLDNYVEVINLGISAVNSFTILDLMLEILELEPDCILIYMGHNEFYGAYGIGSSHYIGKNRNLILLYLKLKQYRFVQAINKFINWIKAELKVETEIDHQSLMEIMAREKQIHINSEKIKIACTNFEENLTDIIKLAQQKNVQVVVSNLVSNLKDQKPFISELSIGLSRQNLDKFTNQFEFGKSYQQSEEDEEAIDIFLKLLQSDSLNAQLHFCLANSYLTLNDSSKAYFHFLKAKDYDLLRFRAPSIFNESINQIAKKCNIPMVNMSRIFNNASPFGIPGNNLFHEHLHPNFNGYRLMAQSFFETLKNIQIINPPEKIVWKDSLLSDIFIENVLSLYKKDNGGVTLLDLEFGKIRTFLLTRNWPFLDSSQICSTAHDEESKYIMNIANEHIQKKLNWNTAHYNLADFYTKNSLIKKAIMEYRAVNLSFYENYYPHFKIGDLYFIEKKYDLAQIWFQRALKFSPQNALILSKLGHVLVLMNKFSKAINILSQIIDNDSKTSKLDDLQKATVLYLLALSNANLKNWQQAELHINNSLKYYPDYEPSIKLKRDIEIYLTKKVINE